MATALVVQIAVGETLGDALCSCVATPLVVVVLALLLRETAPRHLVRRADALRAVEQGSRTAVV